MKNISVTAILSIIVGIIGFLLPNIMPYLFSIYLIIIGVLGLTNKS